MFPEGCDSLTDLPYNVAEAIKAALTFLSYEELPQDERPPKKIWLDEEAMKSHWDQVKADRESKYGSAATGGSGKTIRNAALDDLGL